MQAVYRDGMMLFLWQRLFSPVELNVPKLTSRILGSCYLWQHEEGAMPQQDLYTEHARSIYKKSTRRPNTSGSNLKLIILEGILDEL